MKMRHGFTLIELLVVIAIIAILAAILFPVFARARAKAQQNNCLSNIKELALATISYCTDYDDYYPFSWNTTGNQGYSWATEVYPYVKNLQIYNCPAGTDVCTYSATGYGYGPMEQLTGYDFLENPCVGSTGCCNGCASGGVVPALKQGLVLNPVQFLLIYGTSTSGPYGGENPDGSAASPGSWASANIVETRHNLGANVAFGDGHAAWQSDQTLLNTYPQNANGFRGWSNNS
jgi:prepilin-type N-terminal cleavage/methylation domain-containing protein/prepilin-type processing-associated H-X9-DG protein